MSNKVLSTPHDKFFHSAMTKSEVAKEFLKQHLPSKIQSIIDINSLQYEDTTYVDDTLKKQVVDMLYSVNFEGEKEGYIYILVEHQSSVERIMPLRLLKYMIQIMEAHINRTFDKNLPIVYPLIFYTGKRKYYESTDLFDLFGKQKELAKNIILEPYQLIDVNKISDEKLMKFILSGIMAKTMKHIRKISCFSLIKEDIKIIENQNWTEYNNTIITYLFEAGNIPDKEDFIKKIKGFSEEIGEKIMSSYITLKQQCIKEGIEKGIKKGIEKGKLETAKNIALQLLKSGMDIIQAAKITGLSLNEIETITR